MYIESTIYQILHYFQVITKFRQVYHVFLFFFRQVSQIVKQTNLDFSLLKIELILDDNLTLLFVSEADIRTFACIRTLMEQMNKPKFSKMTLIHKLNNYLYKKY